MNSSTSSSDPMADSAAWRRFLRVLLGIAVGGLLLLVTGLVVVDPYDSGRLTPWPQAGAPRTGQRLSQASRGRDPAFDSAIIGNSHMQLLSPERLRQLTGLNPVSLVVPASGVQEQMAILGWFLRHRTSPPRAVIIGVDNYTCAAGVAPLQTLASPSGSMAHRIGSMSAGCSAPRPSIMPASACGNGCAAAPSAVPMAMTITTACPKPASTPAPIPPSAPWQAPPAPSPGWTWWRGRSRPCRRRQA